MCTIKKNSELLEGVVNICAVKCTDIKSITKWPDNQDVIIFFGIEFSTDWPNFKFETAIDSIIPYIKSEKSDAGIYYDVHITAFIPGGYEKSNIDYLRELQQNKLVVFLDLYDGVRYRLGNKNVGLTFQYKKLTQPAGLEIFFFGQILEPPRPVWLPDGIHFPL